MHLTVILIYSFVCCCALYTRKKERSWTPSVFMWWVISVLPETVTYKWKPTRKAINGRGSCGDTHPILLVRKQCCTPNQNYGKCVGGGRVVERGGGAPCHRKRQLQPARNADLNLFLMRIIFPPFFCCCCCATCITLILKCHLFFFKKTFSANCSCLLL